MIFDGKWQVVIATPIGKQAVLFDITTHEGTIRGTATQGDETVNFEQPVIHDNRLSWWQNVTRPLKLRLKFDVEVDGDHMTGSAKAGLLPASTLTGERVK